MCHALALSCRTGGKNVVKEVLGKLDAYEFLTNLLPGFFFGFGLQFLLKYQLPVRGDISDVLLYYFLGLIISRFGSVVVEPCLKKIHLIEYSTYSNFLAAEKSDSKLAPLLTSCNFFRSLLASALLFPAVWCLNWLADQWNWLGNNWKAILVVALILLFFASYKKQVSFIRARVDAFSNAETNQEK